jgi:hypothetical protein
MSTEYERSLIKAVLERSTSLAGETAANEGYVLVMSYLKSPRRGA